MIRPEIKDKLHFRQLKLTLDSGKVYLAAPTVEVEAKLGCGEGTDKENIAILLERGY